MLFLDILVIFRLDLSQITFNPVENAFATQQLALLATSNDVLVHCDSSMRRNQNFGIFFLPSFFSFSLLFAAVIDLLLGLLAVKKLLRKHHRDG